MCICEKMLLATFGMQENENESIQVSFAREQAIVEVAARLRCIGDDLNKRYSASKSKDVFHPFQNAIFQEVLLEMKRHFLHFAGYLQPK